MAASIDGKIGPTDRAWIRFGAADEARLERCCAAADALLMGAGALRATGSTVRVRAPELLAERRAAGRPEQPLSCVVTASGRLDAESRFFTKQAVPRLVATTADGAAALPARVRAQAEVWVSPGDRVDLSALRVELAQRGLVQLVLLGGGELNAAWLAREPVDRIELTVAPLLIGGETAPTVLDGPGLPELQEYRLEHVEASGELVFLTYQRGPQ